MVPVAHLTTLRAPVFRVLAAVVCAVVLVGCTDKASTSSPSTTDVTTSTIDRADHRGHPGDELALGQRTLVTWRAGKTRQSQVSLRVTKVERGKIADLRQFPLTDPAKASSVYYVWVGVTNTGSGDLGGAQLTLYGKVSDRLVVPPVTLNSPFERCSNPPLPKRFTRTATARVCLVLLAPHHGRISQVQWRGIPAGPVSWLVHSNPSHAR